MACPQRQRAHVASLRPSTGRLIAVEPSRDVRYLTVDGSVIEVAIVRRRRKTLAIHVFPDRPVELRAPLRCSWKTMETFLDSKRQWIADSLRSLAGDEAPVTLRYVEGERHYYLGRPLPLHIFEGRTRRVSVTGDGIAVRCKAPDDANEVKGALERFYRSEALRLLPERIEACRNRFAPPPDGFALSVRKMRARWGSCSSEGEICLNWLLVQKAVEAIDFVVTHELCHLRHFAHNKSFYRLMDRAMPDWRAREQLLSRSDVRLQLDLF